MADNPQNSLGALQAQTDALKKSTTDLTKTLEDFTKEIEDDSEKFKKYTELLKDGTEKTNEVTDALKKFNDQLNLNAKVFDSTKNSIDQNKALLAFLQQQYENLNGTVGNHSKRLKTMQQEIAQVTVTIDNQQVALEKSRDTFNRHAAAVNALKANFSQIKESAGAFGPALDSASKGFNVLKTGLDAAKTGFTSVGAAIKTTGLGLLVLVLQSVVEYFTKTKEGSKILSGGLAVIGKVVKTVSDLFAGMGKFIIDAVTHPVDSIKAIARVIEDNIINRFKSFGVILDGIIHLDFKKIGDGLIQNVTGITNATDKISTAFTKTKAAVIAASKDIVKTYQDGTKIIKETEEQKEKREEAEAKRKEELAQKQEQLKQRQENARIKSDELAKQAEQEKAEKTKKIIDDASAAREDEAASIARAASAKLSGYAKEIADTEQHYADMLKKYKEFNNLYDNADAAFQAKYKERHEQSKKAIIALSTEKDDTLARITESFQQQDLKKLEEYESQLNKITQEAGKNAQELALSQLEEKYKAEDIIISKAIAESTARNDKLSEQMQRAKGQKLNDLKVQIAAEQAILDKGAMVKKEHDEQYNADKRKLLDDESNKNQQNFLSRKHDNSDWQKEFAQRKNELDQERTQAIAAANSQSEAIAKVNADFDKKQRQLDKAKLAAQAENNKQYLKSADALSNAVTGIFGKNTVASRIAFKAHQAAAAGQVIIDTQRSIMGIWSADTGLPLIGVPKAIAETAIVAAAGATSLASIVKQKPGFAAGGQFHSDGKGALLPGYSRTDNTNAYLRSGEAVVVSEAMRNPWARNLVSAINVAHGGRDFSLPASGKGYAIGGIFTDGGNSNRYYSQPLNDVKDLANTLAYQMINNFPPVYVDVKDINTQQNILAQTVDRVNL